MGIIILSNYFTNQVETNMKYNDMLPQCKPHLHSVELVRKYRVLSHRDKCSKSGEKMSLTAWVVFIVDIKPVQVSTKQVLSSLPYGMSPRAPLLTNEQHNYGFTAISFIRPFWHLLSQFTAMMKRILGWHSEDPCSNLVPPQQPIMSLRESLFFSLWNGNNTLFTR